MRFRGFIYANQSFRLCDLEASFMSKLAVGICSKCFRLCDLKASFMEIGRVRVRRRQLYATLWREPLSSNKAYQKHKLSINRTTVYRGLCCKAVLATPEGNLVPELREELPLPPASEGMVTPERNLTPESRIENEYPDSNVHFPPDAYLSFGESSQLRCISHSVL